MILDGLSVQTLLVVLIVENFCDDHFWRRVFAVLILMVRIAIRCIALWPWSSICWIVEAGWIEEGVRIVNTGIDIADLDPCTGGRPACLTALST